MSFRGKVFLGVSALAVGGTVLAVLKNEKGREKAQSAGSTVRRRAGLLVLTGKLMTDIKTAAQAGAHPQDSFNDWRKTAMNNGLNEEQMSTMYARAVNRVLRKHPAAREEFLAVAGIED